MVMALKSVEGVVACNNVLVTPHCVYLKLAARSAAMVAPTGKPQCT